MARRPVPEGTRPPLGAPRRRRRRRGLPAAPPEFAPIFHVLPLDDFVRNLLRIGNVALVALDPEGRFTLFNRGAERMSGYRAREVLGRRGLWRRVFPGKAEHDRFVAYSLSTIRRGGVVEDLETPIRTRGGEPRLISWYASPLWDAAGRIVGGVATGRDITARRQAEAAAQEHRRQLELAVQDLRNRERRMEAVRAVARAILLARDVRTGLGQVPEILRSLVGADDGLLFLTGTADGEPVLLTAGRLPAVVRRAMLAPGFRGARLTRRAIEMGRVVRVDDIRASAFTSWYGPQVLKYGQRSVIVAPISGRDRPLGTIEFASRTPGRFTAADEVFLGAIAQEIGVIIEHRLTVLRLADRERRLAEVSLDLRRARETERHQVAALLHDDLGQMLSLARIQLDLADQRAGEPARVRTNLREARAGIDRVLAGMRDLAGRLEPGILSDFDLEGALWRTVADLAATRSERVTFERRGAGRRPPRETEWGLFRIALEAVNNALRHARATAVRVRLLRRPGRTVVTVADDGRGFDPKAAATRGLGLGLRLIHDRAESLGGTCTVISSRGKGTTLRVAVPLGGTRHGDSSAPGR